MERYLHRNRLSETMDAIGVTALLYMLGTLWFIWLWGLNGASLLAGAALGSLLWAGRRAWRKRNVTRREKMLRSRLGAELMLEDMMMAEAEDAHRRAAMLLARRWPVTMQDANGDGAICRQGKEMLLIRCVGLPEDGELSAGELLLAQRAARKTGADRVVLCSLGKVSPRMMAKAEAALVPVRIIRRSALLAIAGQVSPATDAQLIELGRRRKRMAGQGGVLCSALRPEKAKRYYCYGLGMLLLFVLMDMRLYAVMGMSCLSMAVMCRWRKPRQELL